LEKEKYRLVMVDEGYIELSKIVFYIAVSILTLTAIAPLYAILRRE